jgi:dinuclear metal center YbgI/SA1388 family protein
VTTTVGDWVGAARTLWPESWAESWDAVGLVTGSLDTSADTALFAIDPTHAVLDEALARDATLILTHHPLLLTGVHSVAATDARGRLVDRLVREGVALYVAHTNADLANPGVSDALARALGLADLRPLAPTDPDPAYKLVTFVPESDVDRVLDAVTDAGAGTIGDYTRCAFLTEGTGTFEAGATADPAVGKPGERTVTPEVRVETVVPPGAVAEVERALRAVHPYEEPAFDLIRVVVPHERGLGRVGTLPEPTTLDAFVRHVAATLPATAAGVRATGEPDRPVRTVAVCGGSGADLTGRAQQAGVDVYLTADLKHHAASDAAADGLALVDVAHWASEWPWLVSARDALVSALGAPGRTVDAAVSTLVTDPWRLHAAADRSGGTSP